MSTAHVRSPVGSKGKRMNRELDFMADLLAKFLAVEDPNDVARILSRLDTTLPTVLHGLPGGMQGEVVYHLLQLREGPYGLMRRTVLDLGGIETVADILNNSGASMEKKILDYLDRQDAGLAEEIRNQMFTFEDIAGLPDEDIQHLWENVDSTDMGVALRAVDEKVKQRLLSIMSPSYRTQVQEAPSDRVQVSDVESAEIRIVQQMRVLEEQGKVSIVRGEGGVRDYIL